MPEPVTQRDAPTTEQLADALDLICRQMLAETMRPCRELPRDERDAERLEASDRNTVLAAWNGRGEQLHLKAV